MDLIILVYGDPWSPDLPHDAALRPGLVRAFTLACRAAHRLICKRIGPSGGEPSPPQSVKARSACAPCSARPRSSATLRDSAPRAGRLS